MNYHNNKQLNKENIRQYIDLISGETDLFTGTILENIQLDNKYEEKQLTKVVKEAEIYDDLKRLQEGYQTLVGEKGVKLSGGQKQRILIVRALLRNKPIMIFDHSFNKLDNQTRDKIWQHLIKKYPQTTMIFITHHLEINQYVDKIFKLDKGTLEIQNREKEIKNEMER